MLGLAIVLASCGKEQGGRTVIGFSQANLGEPWRVAMNAEVAEAAKAHPELEFVYADAQQDNARQVADVENFLRQNRRAGAEIENAHGWQEGSGWRLAVSAEREAVYQAPSLNGMTLEE